MLRVAPTYGPHLQDTILNLDEKENESLPYSTSILAQLAWEDFSLAMVLGEGRGNMMMIFFCEDDHLVPSCAY